MRAELFLSRVGERLWAALREDGRTVEFHVERAGDPPRLGRIVKACVTRLIPSIQAVFVEVGLGRDAFLHASELLVPGEPPRPAGSPLPAIQERVALGHELLVQVSRESTSAKGDRVTCNIALPGRLLVLLPLTPQVGISRRIVGSGERERLTSILSGLDGGRSGFVARTAAEGAQRDALEAESRRLLASWHAIRDRAETALAPAAVHDEPPLGLRLLRDAPAAGLERVVLDDAGELARARAYLAGVDGELASRIERHDGPVPLFSMHGLDDEMERALQPRVWLPSGGYLVIQQTEALVSIDVNTGKWVHGDCQEETSLATNLEAAQEIARQLRLRDLGGIVVIDFVDMESAANRRRLVEGMEQALRNDPARTKLVGLSEIGLLQLTRKRTRSGLLAALTQACPACAGQGHVLLPEVAAALARSRRQES